MKSPHFTAEISPSDISVELSEKGLSLFFEGHLPLLALQFQQLPPVVKDSFPLRISLLATLLQSDPDKKQLDGLYTALYKEKDYAACCACAGGAIAKVWEQGINLKSYTPWLKRINALLTGNQELPFLAQSYLFLLKGIAEMTGSGDLDNAKRYYQQQYQLAEEAGSASLRVVGAAAHAYTLCWSGNLTKAELLLLDTEPLLTDPQVSPLYAIQHQTTLAIVKTIQGKTDAAVSILSAIIAHPLFSQAPVSLQVLTFNHLLDTHIVAGDLQGIETIASQIRKLSIPAQNNFHRSYMHFSLGEAALVEQRPHKALSHAEEATHRSEACHSKVGVRMSALLHGQILTDMGHHEEALQHFEQWNSRWIKARYNLIAALGQLETAAIHYHQGQTEKSKLFWDKAHRTLPPGEKMFHLYRSHSFYTQLEKHLFPPTDIIFTECLHPVRITCLGTFCLQINGEKFHNQNWRGRQTKTLLKALIALGGKEVPYSTLSALLWPDADGDHAINSLNVTLNRLRTMGKNQGKTIPWVIVHNQKLSLNEKLCCVDALIFQKQIVAALKAPNDTQLLQRTIDLYSGNFLEEDTDDIWNFNLHNKLLSYYIQGVLLLEEPLIQHGDTLKFISLLEQAVNYDPANESLYWKLMNTYRSEKNYGKALDIYKRAVRVLDEEFNTSPGQPLRILADRIKHQTRGI